MMYLLGLAIAAASLVASVIHLGQSAESYFDFVAVAMVLGGTVAVAIITMPWDQRREIRMRFFELFSRHAPDRKRLLQQCMSVNENALNGVFSYTPTEKGLAQEILRDGVEMIQLGLAPDKIHAMLKERLFQGSERTRTISASIRSLAKYPPAFGLVGTVLGLVHLMHGVSDGMSPQETGIRMAVALVATFYGLLVANLIVNPIGEAIAKNAVVEEKMGEIAVQAVLLAADRVNLLEAQEMLNSYVDASERIDVLGLNRGEPAEVAA